MTTFGAALAQNTAAPHGLHALAKTMYFLTLALVRLIGSFHEKTTVLLKLGFIRETSYFAETGEKSDDSIL
jgi:hypothetical protein